MLGGWSSEKPADSEIQALIETDDVRRTVGGLLGFEVTSLVVQSYRTQVVAGMNYQVKVVVNGTTHVLLKAFKPLPHTGESLTVKSADAE